MQQEMTDRELLEDAAKAVGIELTEASWGGGRDGFYWVVYDQPGRVDYWNPITDDGDALRLAVKLNLGISIPIHKTIRADVVCFRNSSVNVRQEGEDPYAATRRAIVRAAAEIGRSMK